MNQIIRFIIVGITTAVVDLGTLYFLYELLSFNRYVSVIVAYLTGLILNFLLSKFFTYKVLDGNLMKQLSIFVVIALCNLLFTLALIYILTNYFNVPVINARVLCLVVTTPVLFIINKVITFRTKSNREEVY